MKKLILIIIACVIGAGGAAGAGTYYFVNKDKIAKLDEKQEMITRLEKQVKSLTDKSSTSTSAKTSTSESSDSNKSDDSTSDSEVADATAGWQTYTNRDIGYIVKYPQEWTLQETNTWTEDNRHVRYITIHNQDNSIHPISIHWGFVRNGTNLYSTDRTGIGAGDIVEVVSSMTILGAPIKKTKLTFENKNKEYFYTPLTQPTSYTWEASIATRDDVNNTASNNLADYSEVDMAEAILANVQLMS